MSDKPDFDLAAAHKYFSATCFNKTWEYIDNPHRTPEEDMSMLQTAMTSLWHWSQREDATLQNLSVGNWQVSRVYALLGQVDNARGYAEVSLKLAKGYEPFYAAFAYEALARAEMVAGNKAKMQEYLDKALALAEKVEDEEDKQVLMADLGSIK
jgi:tetratricopeptide (TPR) repeat protein